MQPGGILDWTLGVMLLASVGLPMLALAALAILEISQPPEPPEGMIE